MIEPGAKLNHRSILPLKTAETVYLKIWPSLTDNK